MKLDKFSMTGTDIELRISDATLELAVEILDLLGTFREGTPARIQSPAERKDAEVVTYEAAAAKADEIVNAAESLNQAETLNDETTESGENGEDAGEKALNRILDEPKKIGRPSGFTPGAVDFITAKRRQGLGPVVIADALRSERGIKIHFNSIRIYIRDHIDPLLEEERRAAMRS